MNLTRRHFIALSGGAIGAAAFAAPGGKPLLRLGVVSDIHVFSSPEFPFSHPGFPYGRGSVAPFVRALEYFRARKIDALLLPGDITESGIDTQLKAVADAFESVFPGGKGIDGRKVERLFLYGNHDCNEPFRHGRYGREFFREKLGSDSALEKYGKEHAILGREREAWEYAFGEEWRPVMTKTVNGVPFILASWWHDNEESAAYMEKALASLDPHMPFFYSQHRYMRGTNWGSYGFDPDKGLLTRLFAAKAPNAVVVSGHTHYSLTDERSLWQDGFTALGASTLAYTGCLSGFENTHPAKGQDRVLQMPQIGGLPEGQQGMVIDVFADGLRIERREFVHGKELAPDWMVPLPAPKDSPVSHASRRRKETPPGFPSDAKVVCSRTNGKDRSGKATKQIVVEFSGADETAGRRAYAYAVSVEKDNGSVAPVPEKRVIAPYFFLTAEAAKSRSKQVCPKCVFAEDELPDDTRFRFAVRAVNSFGVAGAPVHSDWIDKNGENA